MRSFSKLNGTDNKAFDWCLDDVFEDEILSHVLSSEHEMATEEEDLILNCASVSRDELGNLLKEAGSDASLPDRKERLLNSISTRSEIENLEQISKMSLEDLNLSDRWLFQFENAGIYALSDLYGKDLDEIREIPGIGNTAICELEDALIKTGLPELKVICTQNPLDNRIDNEVEGFVGAHFAFDGKCSKKRIINYRQILGKPLDGCEHQENLLGFFCVSPEDSNEIHLFCEKNQIGWFSAIWNNFDEAARLVFGPEEPLETLLLTSIDHLVTDLGSVSFEKIINELAALFERKLGINLSLDESFEKVRLQCFPELKLVKTRWLSQVLYPGLRDNPQTIDKGLNNKSLSILELYSIKKAIVALSEEAKLYSQANSWQMLFAQAICDCLQSFKPKSAMTMYLPRLGISVEGRAPTLEEVGNSAGVTRERVRQVEKKMSDQVDFECARRLVPLRISLYSAVVDLGGIAKPEQIAELLNSIGLEIIDLNIENTVALFSELSYDSRNRLVSLSSMPCTSCEKAAELCRAIAQNNDYISSADFYHQAGCAACPFPLKPDLRLFGTIDGLKATENYLGGNTNPVIVSKLRPTSIRACIKAALFATNRAFSIQELADIATKSTGKKASKNAVNSLVTSLEDCSLWGRGTYINNRNMPFPEELLKQISDFCCARFKDAKTPLVGAGGVYEFFSEQLKTEGIPNEQALYSLLRMHADHRLELREYPWICDTDRIYDRTTFAKYFYSIVEANNGFITDAHAKEIANRAMTQYWALDGLSQYSPFLIRANGGWFNIEAAGFDLDGVASLACEIASKMRDNDIVSCRKVFENHKERCYSYGVKSYDILYRLIDMMEDDLPLTASRIPHLIKTDKPTMGVKDAVRLYIRNSPNPVTHSEIVEEFGERRGIKTSGLCPALLLGKDIIETAQGTFWSIDNLKIDSEFMIKFDNSIKALTDSALCEAGLFYSKSRIIPSFECLPNIPNIRWTDTLLNAIFKQSKTFKSFGETGECIVDAKLNPSVKNVEGFYYTLLKNEFYGWTAFGKFADYCAAHQICQGLEPEFFDAFDSIEASQISIECK